MPRRRGLGGIGGPRYIAAWLALLAILLQAWLPLLDARLHQHGSEPLTVAAAPSDEARGPASDRGAPDKQHCVLHQFMQALGSYAAPGPALLAPPATGSVATAWLPRTEPDPATGLAAARARAPPARA